MKKEIGSAGNEKRGMHFKIDGQESFTNRQHLSRDLAEVKS